MPFNRKVHIKIRKKVVKKHGLSVYKVLIVEFFFPSTIYIVYEYHYNKLLENINKTFILNI